MLAVVTLLLACGGCKKDLTVKDFPLAPGVTAEKVADKVGSPTREAAHWVAYTLKDTNELRLYFLEGPKGGIRTLSEAAVYDKRGVRLETVFQLENKHPSTKPATTRPATRGE